MLATERAIFRTVALQSYRAGGGVGGRTLRAVALTNLNRQAFHSWSAIQETCLYTKIHRAVFTIGTSIVSDLTVWAGSSIRHVHQTNVEKRLGSIDEAVNKNYNVKHEDIKNIVGSVNASTTACIAVAGTSLIIG